MTQHNHLRFSLLNTSSRNIVLLQSGAKHVYGIECSAIADQAKRIVADNGFSDKVTIIKGKVGAVTQIICAL